VSFPNAALQSFEIPEPPGPAIPSKNRKNDTMGFGAGVSTFARLGESPAPQRDGTIS